MSLDLTPESVLADELGITIERAAKLRRANNWPHVRLSRSDIRYTAEQVVAVLAIQTVKPERRAAPAITGQTAGSRRRSA